jgi:hypothetical protein
VDERPLTDERRGGHSASRRGVSADVDEAAARYARFVNRPAIRTRAGQSVALDRGRIDLVTRDAFAAALPEIAVPSLPFIAGYGVTMRLLEAVELALRSRDLPSRRTGHVLVVPFPEELGQGMWLFSENSQASLFG